MQQMDFRIRHPGHAHFRRQGLPDRIAPSGFLLLLLLSACTPLQPRLSVRSGEPPAKLNSYVLRAIDTVELKYAGLGYDQQAFTHDLPFGKDAVLPASKKPVTMCVAAQMEVLVEALNLYATETGDFSAFSFLQRSSWTRLAPTDFRGQVWVVAGSPAYGMSDALRNLGMGEKKAFERLEPGDFVNFNRDNGTGHAVVFLAYLDLAGNELPAFGPTVEGFKYFSSQGRGPESGLGYRYAFFKPTDACPILSHDKKRDCGVIRSASQRLYSAGSAWLPSAYDRAAADAFRKKYFTRAFTEGSFDAAYFTGLTTDD
jgi:hypothetical protein